MQLSINTTKADIFEHALKQLSGGINKLRQTYAEMDTKSGRMEFLQGTGQLSSGNITDEMIQQYIEEQEGEPIIDDSRFSIDDS